MAGARQSVVDDFTKLPFQARIVVVGSGEAH
jgi:hypothetical protein